MENKEKIIIVALIIVIVALLVGIFAAMPHTAKKDTKLIFKSNSTLTEGGSIKIKLTDANGTAIANQTVNITITDKSKSSDYHSVVTDSKGIGTLKIDKDPGKYNVTVSYNGNDNFTGCNATKKIKIEKKVIEETNQNQNEYVGDDSSSSSSSNENYRPDVDSGGITRETADKFGYEYTTDHGGHYIGKNDHWDENAGVYHD